MSLRPAAVPALLAIAGSDPSGGAGIQADLKTCQSLGVYGAAAITCLTAQDTRGVRAVLPVPVPFFREQVGLVLADLAVSHIKIGMVGTAELACALGEILDAFPGTVVLDPVLAASDGHPLFEAARAEVLMAEVGGRADLLTPNLPELAALAGLPPEASPLAMAEKLLDRLPRLAGIVIKGGHATSNEIQDLLVLRQPTGPARVETARHPRLASPNTHGTGCTLATALTALHLTGGDWAAAFRQAVAYVADLIALGRGLAFGHGRGPLPHHLWTGPGRTAACPTRVRPGRSPAAG
ncbi:MAG: bifunctional hydroxymethylpyrimidine kinase/phosphomethylpyrimidine kinase [Thermodesulfobacteriota bacterium]